MEAVLKAGTIDTQANGQQNARQDGICETIFGMPGPPRRRATKRGILSLNK